MRRELPKNYAPKEFEDRIYTTWCERGYFHADPKKKGPAFSIVIPPPNVTGQLHMGHALDETLQDILVRYKRMQGFNTLWVPGTDHAGIATQIKVEEQLRVNEHLTRYDLGREKFLERVWAWKNQYGDRIISQLKKLGTSCDWSRERFTMDEGCSRAVREVFCNLYDKGIIYRGYRIINLCPRCKTALSDAEVEYEEQNGNFWYLKYPIKGEDGYVEIATTRPETMFGDTAVAVNPEDPNTKHLIGKTLILPLVGRELTVIADEYVEIGFGTGCVKITPAHDPNDFLVGQRHNLPQIKVMNDDGTMNAYAGKYEGMDRYECRKALVKDLEEAGYLLKVEPHVHSVGTCYRCKTTVEPITSNQWFMKMEPMIGPSLDAVRSGAIRFVPERFTNNYTVWMENLHDWCISRQLWWGHRIPAFYCDDCGEMIVTKESSAICPKCGKPMRQEEDVLDTWFSSALWPFSTMGWPDETEDLKRYYPTSTLVTGYDIISFWVSRMIFSGLEHTGKAPFSTVFIHGLVRDAQGRKMSKSLGNGIDPLVVIDEYGADALRFALATGNAPGNDMRFSDEKMEAARNFANKIWNASRFVMMNLPEEDDPLGLPEEQDLTMEDRWILSRYNETVKSVCENLDHYEVGVALSLIYDFAWDTFCDWYVELSKSRIFQKETKEAQTARRVLVYVLTGILKLLHPYMPFITEEIYLALPHEDESIMISDYPKFEESLCFKKEQESMEQIITAIRAIRVRRQEMNVPPSKKAKLYITTKFQEVFENVTSFFVKLASASEVELVDSYAQNDAVSIVTDACTIYIPMGELVDFEKERARLQAELEKNKGEIQRIEVKLNNPGFVSKAPAAVIEGEKAKLAKYKETEAQLLLALEKLK